MFAGKLKTMPFEPGHPKPAGSGRKKGQVGKPTLLAREGLKSAIEICRQGGDDPISIMMNAARFLNSVAGAFAPRSGEGVSIIQAIRQTPKADLEFMRKFLESAGAMAQKAAEFGYAKMQRIDYYGDPMVENRTLVLGNLSDDELDNLERIVGKIAGPGGDQGGEITP